MSQRIFKNKLMDELYEYDKQKLNFRGISEPTFFALSPHIHFPTLAYVSKTEISDFDQERN